MSSSYLPTLSSAGIGSGLSVSSMVTGLMSVENLPMKALTSRLSTTLAKISSYGSLKGSFSALQTAAQALNSPQVQSQSATSSNTSVITATSDGSAILGGHTIQVSKLAQQQKLASSGFADPASYVGSGKLTIQFGSVAADGTFTENSSSSPQYVTITPDKGTLTGVRDAINASGLGVTATLVNDGSTNGNRLVFTSNDSGTNNTLRITATDDDGNNTDASGLSQLAYDPANDSAFVANPKSTQSVSQVQTAKDASLTVDGIGMTKSSNTITDALPGVTLNLLAEQSALATPVNLDVGWDMTKVTDAVSAFVKAYNGTQSSVATETSFDPTGKTSNGPLNGQFLPRTLLNGVNSAMMGEVNPNGALASLSDMGVTLNKDGTLSLDSIKLQISLRQSPSDFKSVLAKVGSAVDTYLGEQLDPNTGTLTAAQQSLDSEQQNITKRQTALQDRLDLIQARYTAQFSSLDTIMSKMQSTSAYLTQQATILTASYKNN